MLAQRTLWALTAALLLVFGQAAMAQHSGAAAPHDAKAAGDQASRTATRSRVDANAEQALKQLFAENAGAKTLFGKAAGYAVFSGTKAGFIVSGAGGLGVAVNKKTRQRTYMKMGSAGVGLSFGARRYDLIILFENQEHLANFVKGGWDSSATAEATAGTESKGVGSTFFDGIAIFRLTNRGLMANADVSGTRFWVADDLN
ncbi:MAG TPA: lipid-binding SYLF domain-containing protein [Gammaproteobacteria bacterium]|nr:lipid-binding SYLF domain-containing protein [Gammaproteobacteria bacterium]